MLTSSGPGGARQRSVRDAADTQPVGIVVADLAAGKSVELVRADDVHAADEFGSVADGAQRMGVGQLIGRQGVVIVPAAMPDRLFAGEQGHPARQADRRVAVGVVEDDTVCRQPIEIGGGPARIAVAPGETLGMLIREDEEEIRTRGATHDCYLSVCSRLAIMLSTACSGVDWPINTFWNSGIALVRPQPS